MALKPRNVTYANFVLGEDPLILSYRFAPRPNTTPQTDSINVTVSDAVTEGNIILPPVKSLPLGHRFTIANLSIKEVVVKSSDNVTLVTIQADAKSFLFLRKKENGVEEWAEVPDGDVIRIQGLNITSPNLVISGNPLTPPGGDIDLSFAYQPGFLAYSVDGDVVNVFNRTFQDSSQILITNPDGASGNPSLTLAQDIDNNSSLRIGNFVFGSDDLFQLPFATETFSITSNNSIFLNSFEISEEGDFTFPGLPFGAWGAYQVDIPNSSVTEITSRGVDQFLYNNNTTFILSYPATYVPGDAPPLVSLDGGAVLLSEQVVFNGSGYFYIINFPIDYVGQITIAFNRDTT